MYTYCIDKHKYNNVMYMHICAHIACDLQAIMLRWPSSNPVEILFIKSIALRGYVESNLIGAPVSILGHLGVFWDSMLMYF